MEYLYEDITDKIIKAYYNVYNTLGYGFLEKVYHNALLVELEKMGLACKNHPCIKVFYDAVQVGEYFADIFVEDRIIVENKTVECLVEENELQLINYLRANEIEVGLLLNFGKKPEFKRKIFTNNRKKFLRKTKFSGNNPC